MECKEILIAWLNNAYSMELSMIETLEKHVEDAEELPEVQEKLRSHIEETKEQAEKVKSEIERLGGDTSSIKAGMAEMMGKMSGMSTELAKDKIVKNAIAEHAAEHFEMATYMAISHAAKLCGEEETAQMAKDIMEEEKTTGEELEMYLKMVVEHYVNEQKREENEEMGDEEE